MESPQLEIKKQNEYISLQDIRQQIIELSKKYKVVKKEDKPKILAKLNNLEKEIQNKTGDVAEDIRWMLDDLKNDLSWEGQEFDIDSIEEDDIIDTQELIKKLKKNSGNSIIISKLIKKTKKIRNISNKDLKDIIYIYNHDLGLESLNFNLLTRISYKQVEMFANSNIEWLQLNGLTRISDRQAEILADGNIAFLQLNGLTRISDKQAEMFANSSIEWLQLNGLTRISDKQAEILGKGKYKTLELNGLTRISDKQTEIFANSSIEGLFLDYGIREKVNSYHNNKKLHTNELPPKK